MNAYTPLRATDQSASDVDQIAIEFQSRFGSRGLISWWLKLTSGGWKRKLHTTRERETSLRMQRCSVVLFVLFVTEVLLIPVGLNDAPTLQGQIFVGIAIAAAIFCNRHEWVTAAAIILVIAISITVFAVIYTAPSQQLSMAYLPSLALYTLPAMIAAMLLTTYWAFVVLGGVVGVFMSHLLLQPLAPDAQAAAIRYGWAGLWDIELIVVVVAFFGLWYCVVSMRRAYAFSEAQIREKLAERQGRLREQLRAEHQRAQAAQRDEFVRLLSQVINEYAQSPTHGARVLPAINSSPAGPMGSFPPSSAREPMNLTREALSIDLALSRLRSQLATAAEQEQGYQKLLAALAHLASDLADVRRGQRHISDVLNSTRGVHEYNEVVRELVLLFQGAGGVSGRDPGNVTGYSASVPTSPTLRPSSAPPSYPHSPQSPMAPPPPSPGEANPQRHGGWGQPGQPSPGRDEPQQWPDLVPEWLRRDSSDKDNNRF